MCAGTAGCEIVVTVVPVAIPPLEAVAPSVAEPGPVALVGDAPSLLLVQAAVTSASATITTSRRERLDPWGTAS
jgi:hypothetical protein